MIRIRNFLTALFLFPLVAFDNNDNGAEAFCTYGFSTSSQACSYWSDREDILNSKHFSLFYSSSSSSLSPQLSTTRRKTKKTTAVYLSTNRVIDLSSRQRESSLSTTRIFLVSEEDVLEAVERAETLWAEALESRKNANTSSDRAEKKAEASAGQSEKAANIFQDRTTPVSKEQLIQVDTATKNSLDATSFVNKALEASDEADRLEQEAEEALRNSEEQLDQHLKDFPNSSLA